MSMFYSELKTSRRAHKAVSLTIGSAVYSSRTVEGIISRTRKKGCKKKVSWLVFTNVAHCENTVGASACCFSGEGANGFTATPHREDKSLHYGIVRLAAVIF